ncbi:putative vacuolar ATP synthase subunit E [Gigaspora margarita]|uniref:Putative vacuolar ATP synthase subunit E n=1 Tax=Gigaspora margarita TaxID=4874 RepID=A0A8H4AQE6_GIGMA|nr:putative vacuolar ATP synthase subunit E [Gigaspora margarita]
MTTSRALTDDEVSNEMTKMVAFINQEANEKANEIRVKADEEFNIEKAKLVRQESINIEATYQRKIKQAEIQKKIAQSNFINKSRLKVLQARQQMLEELFVETRSQLKKISQNKDSYSNLLKDLILQGLYQLMDEKVTVIVKKSELNLAQDAIKIATKTYTDTTRSPVHIEIDEENLPEESAGGVILSSHFGRIKINNTLEERLSLAQDEMLPELRVLLFGHSPNRKFFD